MILKASFPCGGPAVAWTLTGTPISGQPHDTQALLLSLMQGQVTDHHSNGSTGLCCQDAFVWTAHSPSPSAAATKALGASLGFRL